MTFDQKETRSVSVSPLRAPLAALPVEVTTIWYTVDANTPIQPAVRHSRTVACGLSTAYEFAQKASRTQNGGWTIIAISGVEFAAFRNGNASHVMTVQRLLPLGERGRTFVRVLDALLAAEVPAFRVAQGLPAVQADRMLFARESSQFQ